MGSVSQKEKRVYKIVLTGGELWSFSQATNSSWVLCICYKCPSVSSYSRIWSPPPNSDLFTICVKVALRLRGRDCVLRVAASSPPRGFSRVGFPFRFRFSFPIPHIFYVGIYFVFIMHSYCGYRLFSKPPCRLTYVKRRTSFSAGPSSSSSSYEQWSGAWSNHLIWLKLWL